MPPRILTVPMNPEFLPEAALLLAGLIALVLAIRLLFARQPLRGLGVAAIAVACMALALWMGRSGWVHAMNKYVDSAAWSKPVGLVPESTPGHQAEPPFVSLVLGDVLLRVAPADRYVLSVGDQPFLTLDSLRTGLRVSCDLAGVDGSRVRVEDNLVLSSEGRDVRQGKTASAFLLQQQSEDVLRVHFAGPRRIEIAGRFRPFYERASARNVTSGRPEPARVSFEGGIRWEGGGVAPGATIDLTPQGKGRIDFAKSGMIQIRPN